jgi:hypothetical protein
LLSRLLDESLAERTEDEPQLLLAVIHDRDEVEEGKFQVRKAEIVGRRSGQPFKPSDHVVSEVTDGAAVERRISGRAGNVHPSEEAAERRQGIPGAADPFFAPFTAVPARPLAAEEERRIGADDRVTLPWGEPVGALAAFEQNRTPHVPGQPLVELERGEVRQREDGRQGNGRGGDEEGVFGRSMHGEIFPFRGILTQLFKARQGVLCSLTSHGNSV